MNIIPFNFESKEIRVVEINNDPWFVAKDVAVALGYTNTNDAISRHCKGVVKRYPLMTPGGTQEARIISESDVLRLIVGSALPEAVQFENWVFETVLPSIRKNGGYIAGQETDDPELIMAKALQVAQNVIYRKTLELKQAKEIIAIQSPKAEFADRIASAEKGTLIGNFAKAVGLGPKSIFKVLRDQRVLMKGGNRHNLPFQEYIERGYFEVTERPYEVNDETRIAFTPLITGKGQQWITQKLIASGHLKAISTGVPA
ncbi:phage antirepressor KilAC domain-containing protein [Tolumonas lignilytica]|uniref:phage antirepressor KilAC domain-containing protein n=1 Tax=Tolumonas lignilytica TaxID=1283284 RepID=UPI000464225E|nr:phage antirepressor [Tolumonas lignilytica]